MDGLLAGVVAEDVPGCFVVDDGFAALAGVQGVDEVNGEILAAGEDA